MTFEPLPLSGVYRLRMEPHADERGLYARSFCERELAAHGLATRFVQGGVSRSHARGTLRGLHWQAEPHGEDKLIRVTRGRIWDVVVDLRESSNTFGRWHGETLAHEDLVLLYVPRGFAHGFVTLEDDSEVTYQMSAFHEPTAERGARFDDPAFGIEWPVTEGLVVSARDRSFPPYAR